MRLPWGWTLQTDGNSLVLNWTTPEPHHLLLVCAGALFLGLAIRGRWRLADRLKTTF